MDKFIRTVTTISEIFLHFWAEVFKYHLFVILISRYSQFQSNAWYCSSFVRRPFSDNLLAEQCSRRIFLPLDQNQLRNMQIVLSLEMIIHHSSSIALKTLLYFFAACLPLHNVNVYFISRRFPIRSMNMYSSSCNYIVSKASGFIYTTCASSSKLQLRLVHFFLHNLDNFCCSFYKFMEFFVKSAWNSKRNGVT